MKLVPISLREANAYVEIVHRHHGPVRGHKFAIGLQDDRGGARGVVIVGRPVARHLDDGCTAEVLRLATDGIRNGCSMLYGAARRAALAMGYERVITYILQSESGASLRASGWREVGPAGGGSWDRPSRARKDKHPVETKVRYEAA